jgi:hypothetical protein
VRTTISLSSDGFDIASDLERLVALTETLPTTLAQVAADYGEPAVKLAARELRGTLSMSNNRQASELDTLPVVRSGSPHAEAEIVAVPRGAWALVEYGAKPHKIKVRPRSGSKSLRTPGVGGGFYDAVDHPGTAGTQLWTRAMGVAEPIIDEAVQDAFERAVAPDTSGAV